MIFHEVISPHPKSICYSLESLCIYIIIILIYDSAHPVKALKRHYIETKLNQVCTFVPWKKINFK